MDLYSKTCLAGQLISCACSASYKPCQAARQNLFASCATASAGKVHLAQQHPLQELPASCIKQTAHLQQEIAPQVDLLNRISANKGLTSLRPDCLQRLEGVVLVPGNLHLETGSALGLGSRHTAAHREPEEPLVSSTFGMVAAYHHVH